VRPQHLHKIEARLIYIRSHLFLKPMHELPKRRSALLGKQGLLAYHVREDDLNIGPLMKIKEIYVLLFPPSFLFIF